MYIHKEGYRLLLSTLAIFVAITVLMIVFTEQLNFFNWLLIVIMFGFWIALASFFRIPKRVFTEDSQRYIAPADGTICTIEQTFEKEYLNCECLMVSVFMYGTDVHVNRYPVDGTVEYVKYHKGNYFIASYPKSSIMNERASVGMRLENGQKILLRQVSGGRSYGSPHSVLCPRRRTGEAEPRDGLHQVWLARRYVSASRHRTGCGTRGCGTQRHLANRKN